jgi:hypothetical protein
MTEKEEMLQKKRRKLEEEDAYAEFYPGTDRGAMDGSGTDDFRWHWNDGRGWGE